jgi:hypothetical protein
MQTLFPPVYPVRPDAPLLSFGLSFSEEISRSVIAAIVPANEEQSHQSDVRVAASLTMLEAFHPRDHLECMMAAQGVACHATIMECYRRAMLPGSAEPIAIKLRANATQLSRTFSALTHDLERRQLKPPPQRPPDPPNPEGPAMMSPVAGPPGGTHPDCDGLPPLDGRPVSRDARPGEPIAVLYGAGVADRDIEDIETRWDGTPGSLAAYAPKPPEDVFVPREPAIMRALATRPKPWRMVNTPKPSATECVTPDGVPGGTGPSEADALAAAKTMAAPAPLEPRPPAAGPLTDRLFTGDALARFTSARLDPNAPVEPLTFEEDDALVEVELISTGGDVDAERERAAMIAAHPEGKPIVTYRYGRTTMPKKPPDDK